MMRFHNREIETLLQTRTAPKQECDPEDVSMQVPRGSTEEGCDVAFALFMEPGEKPDPRWSWAAYLIDLAIRTGQPSPTMIHCELLIPPVPHDEGSRTQFATYYGHTSGWQSDHLDGLGYYLIEHGHNWRAVPIFASNAAERLRDEANKELGVSYSLARYATSAFPLRAFCNLVPVGRRKPAHCATLLSRVLKNAIPEAAPRHHAAYYGPSTLYAELQNRAGEYGAALASGEPAVSMLPKHTQEAVETLLRKPMTHDTVSTLGDSACMEAIRALTLRVTDAIVAGDAASQRITQKQLATAVLRWVILRDELPNCKVASEARVGANDDGSYFRT